MPKRCGVLLVSIPWCCVLTVATLGWDGLSFLFSMPLGIPGWIAIGVDHAIHLTLPFSLFMHLWFSRHHWREGARWRAIGFLALMGLCLFWHLSPWHESLREYLARV